MGACCAKTIKQHQEFVADKDFELAGSVLTVNVGGTKRFARTAIIMIGYQRDYFGSDGKLREVIEASSDKVLENTLKMIEELKDSSVLMIETPITFTEDYSELVEACGILKVIQDVGAFKAGDPGAETIPEIQKYGKRILQVPGKRGLNAFTGTCLERLMKHEGVTDVVLCGAVTSVCIDSTGRAAHERGFRVHHLSDCTCGRTDEEQEQYCKDIFPLYSDVTVTEAIVKEIKAAETGKSYKPPVSLSRFKHKEFDTAEVVGKRPFDKTAIIMIGYQNDYFGSDGKLHTVIEASSDKVLKNTLKIIEALKGTSAIMVETPIVFTENYGELVEPSGILKIIKDVGAFKAGDPGAETIPELQKYGQRILQIPGKRGFNAFTGTGLEGLLKMERVTDVVLCGAVTSVCIDSTGRAAHERGFRVHLLSDCTCGRTEAEQDHYCKAIFPLYADVTTTDAVLKAITAASSSSKDASLQQAILQEILNDMNKEAGDAHDKLDDPIDETAYAAFEGICDSALIMRWMLEHPEEAASIRDRREELAVQIQHKLVDLAATTQKSYEEMMRNPDDEDRTAPLVTFLSHGKDEAGSVCRLLKLMLKKMLKVTRCVSPEGDQLPVSTPRIFLDADDIYSQSELQKSVHECKSMILVMTKSTFFRPWVICEFVTAWRNGTPIIPVEISDSGFNVTKDNIKDLIAERMDNSIMKLMSQYCPNLDHEQLTKCCTSILKKRRITIDVRMSTATQWASIYDLAKLLISTAQIGAEHKLELTTPDPVRSFVTHEKADQDYVGFISYHHTHNNRVLARIIKMMIEAQVGTKAGTVFLDADSLFDLDTLVSHIERSKNMLVLLSAETLTRPYVIVELVYATRCNVPLIAVPVIKDFDFRSYAYEEFFQELESKFDDEAKKLFRKEGIRFPEIARTIKTLFNVIAQPFYGNSSETVQMAQVHEIIRRLDGPTPRSIRWPVAAKGLAHRGNSI